MKKLFCLVLSFLVIFSLMGCSSNKEHTTKPNNSKQLQKLDTEKIYTTEEVEKILKTYIIYSSEHGERTQVRNLDELAKEYTWHCYLNATKRNGEDRCEIVPKPNLYSQRPSSVNENIYSNIEDYLKEKYDYTYISAEAADNLLKKNKDKVFYIDEYEGKILPKEKYSLAGLFDANMNGYKFQEIYRSSEEEPLEYDIIPIDYRRVQ